jgi:hypothetical protein
VNAVLGVLGAAIGRQWQDAPPLTREQPLDFPAARFSGLNWDVIGEPGSWTGELFWRHPHPVVSGAPCTTHLILREQGSRLDLHLRVTADNGLASVHGTVGAGQTRPPFLTELNRSLRLTFDRYDATPAALAGGDIDAFVRDVLLADEREYPAAVLAPLEEGGYVVPPEELADALLGLAPLWVIERHPGTFRLTDALGDRRLSAYWGALRVYLAGFSCADRPEDHPLLMRDRLIDPVLRADLLGRLGRDAARRHVMPAGVAELRAPSPAPHAPPAPVPIPAGAATPPPPARGHAEPPAPAETAPAGAVSGADREEVGARLPALPEAIARMAELIASLLDEMSRLRTTMAVRAVNTVSLERRIGSLEQLLRRQLAAEGPDTPPPGPQVLQEPEPADEAETLTLVDVLRQAADSHPESLLILEPAEHAAQRSPYEDPDRVAVILDAMASVARRRQAGVLGTSLREAFRELGIDYRGGIAASTSERLRQQYRVVGPDGRGYECEEHIVIGSSYDPRHCLRIYFTSRAPLEARFVIGHVGRHFEVMSTT